MEGALRWHGVIASGVQVVQITYAPGAIRVRSDCPDLQLWWVRAGGWTLQKRGLTEELAVGSASVHAPGEPCRQWVAPRGISLLGVQVPRAYFEGEVALRREELRTRLARLHLTLTPGEREASLAWEESVAALFAAKPEQRETRWLGRVRELLHERFAEPIRLVELANEVDIHEVHLAASFRACVGCTIGEYLRRLRLDDALLRLCTTEDRVADIAQAAGFYDQAHLTRLFRARIGLPPEAFRQHLRTMP